MIMTANDVLYREAIAAWLRTIIDFSLKKNLLEGALEYFEHSVRLLEASPVSFVHLE